MTIFYEVRLCLKENDSRLPVSNIMRRVVNFSFRNNYQYTSILVLCYVLLYIYNVYILVYYIFFRFFLNCGRVKWSIPTRTSWKKIGDVVIHKKLSLKRDYVRCWQYQCVIMIKKGLFVSPFVCLWCAKIQKN